MRTIKLTDSDCIFIYCALKQYAVQNDDLDKDDREVIYEVANKFK